MGTMLAHFTGLNSGIAHHGTNGHRDITWTADSTGAITRTARYDPWGGLLASSGSTMVDFRYQGSWYDTDTDLHWVITRWYAPTLGRFVSEDTLLGTPTNPMSRHLYVYGWGNPVNSWDPDGRAPYSFDEKVWRLWEDIPVNAGCDESSTSKNYLFAKVKGWGVSWGQCGGRITTWGKRVKPTLGLHSLIVTGNMEVKLTASGLAGAARQWAVVDVYIVDMTTGSVIFRDKYDGAERWCGSGATGPDFTCVPGGQEFWRLKSRREFTLHMPLDRTRKYKVGVEAWAGESIVAGGSVRSSEMVQGLRAEIR
jgi:RHS repeat-associated protein